MLETIIKRITEVKYEDSIMPTAKPFCATISATSPRVIMPTPILSESPHPKRHSREVKPQPMILVISATATKHSENSTKFSEILSKLVFKPILAKKTGPKII